MPGMYLASPVAMYGSSPPQFPAAPPGMQPYVYYYPFSSLGMGSPHDGGMHVSKGAGWAGGCMGVQVSVGCGFVAAWLQCVGVRHSCRADPVSPSPRPRHACCGRGSVPSAWWCRVARVPTLAYGHQLRPVRPSHTQSSLFPPKQMPVHSVAPGTAPPAPRRATARIARSQRTGAPYDPALVRATCFGVGRGRRKRGVWGDGTVACWGGWGPVRHHLCRRTGSWVTALSGVGCSSSNGAIAWSPHFTRARLSLSSPCDALQYDVFPGAVGADGRTTVMLRNIPNKYCQRYLLRHFASRGLDGEFDFVYLPIDFRSRCNLGYAFVNVLRPEAVAAFHAEYHGLQWEAASCTKVGARGWCGVVWGEGWVLFVGTRPVVCPCVWPMHRECSGGRSLLPAMAGTRRPGACAA